MDKERISNQEDMKAARAHIRDEHESILQEVMEEMAFMRVEGITSRDYLDFKLDKWLRKLQEVKHYVASTEGI